MAKTVERTSDNGKWWVREDGVRKAHFRTRTEARLYASGGKDTSPRQTPVSSTGKTNLRDLFTQYGEKRLSVLLRRLDPLDMRISSLYLRGATQAEVAESVGISQPSVCYRLQQVVERLRFLLGFPDIDLKQMREDLAPHFTDFIDVLILVMFVETTSQSEVARRLTVTQGYVRHRICRAVETILPGKPELATYLQAVVLTQGNLNILNPFLSRTTSTEHPG